MRECPHCGELHDHFCANFSCKVETAECFECHEEVTHAKYNNHFMLQAIAYIMEENIPYGNGMPLAEEDIKYLPRIPNAAWVRNPGVNFHSNEIAHALYLRGHHELLSEVHD
jgi:hypothetical protein